MPVVQAIVLLFAAAYVFFNLLADLLTVYVVAAAADAAPVTAATLDRPRCAARRSPATARALRSARTRVGLG